MLLKRGRIFLLLYGTISFVITNSALQTSHPEKTADKYVGLRALVFQHDDIRIKETGSLKGIIQQDAISTKYEEIEKPTLFLQTRALGSRNFFKGNFGADGLQLGGINIDDYGNVNIFGHSDVSGIIGNSVVLKEGPSFISFTSSSGDYFLINLRGVYVKLIRPTDHPSITIKGRRVFVNRELVCDYIKKLGTKRTYQKRRDGSMWYTNLKVGDEMAPEKIEEFKKAEDEMEAAIEDARKETDKELEKASKRKKAASRQLKAASRQRKAALEKAREQIEAATRQREALEEARRERERALKEARKARETARPWKNSIRRGT